MIFRKQEAVFYLAHLVGSVDGEFTENEQQDIVLGSSYYRDNIIKSLDKELLIDSVKDGSLTKSSACNVIIDLDKSERIDILASLFFIAASDGNLNDGETGLFAELLVRLSITTDEVVERWKEMKQL